MTIALVCLVLCALGGASLLALIRPRLTVCERIALGTPLGQGLFGLIGFATASLLGMRASVLASSLCLAALVAVALFRGHWRVPKPGRIHVTAGRLAGFAFGVAVTVILWKFFAGACFVNASGAIETTNADNLGDLPYHIGIVRGFTDGDNYPPEHPEFAGARLTYPFLADFFAAQLTVGGASVSQAFFVQNLSLALSLAFLLARFGRSLTRWKPAGALCVALLFCSGGWGFLNLLPEWRGYHGTLWDFLNHLPFASSIRGTDATGPGSALRWGNSLCVLFGTQRSILHGMPLAIGVWILWWRSRAFEPGGLRTLGARRSFLAAAIVAGTLPLGHIHTFLSLLVLAGAYALQSRQWRAWLGFFVIAFAIAAPQLLVLLARSETNTGQFAKLYFGWDSQATNVWGWLLFWFRNTGLFFPLVIFGAALSPPKLRAFWLPTTLLFVIPNVTQLAPWVWDNIKVLIYASVAATPIAARALKGLVSRGIIGKVAAVAIVIVCCAAGALDVFRVISGHATQQIFSREEIDFARRIGEKTAPRSRVLTAPTYNHPVYLSGRRVFLGYTGHLWSHGLDPARREATMKAIYAGSPDATKLLAENGIDYVVVGHKERGDVKALNESFFARFPVTIDTGGYRLYDVRALRQKP